MKIVLEYVGDRYFVGIPARDLTADDLEKAKALWQRDDLEQILLDSGAYQRPVTGQTKAFIPKYENKAKE